MFKYRDFFIFIFLQVFICLNAHAIMLADPPQPTKLQYSLQYIDALERTIDYFQVDENDVSLKIIAQNNNPESHRNPISIDSIKFRIPEGDTARSLVIPGGITESFIEGWEISKSGNDFFASPIQSPALVKGNPLTFTFKNLVINSVQGVSPIEIVELSSDKESRVELEAKKFPRDFFLDDPIVSPPEVFLGENTKVSWLGSPEATYTLTYNGKSITIPTGTYSWVVENLQRNPTQITLTAELNNEGSPGLTLQKSLRVSVLGAVPSLSVDSLNLLGRDAVTLTWNTVNAQEGTAYIQDPLTGQLLYTIPDKDLLRGHVQIRTPVDASRNSITYKLVYQDKDTKGQVTRQTPTVRLYHLKVIKTLNVGKSPVAVGISQDGKVAYVANSKDVSLSFIDLEQRKVLKTIPFKYRDFMRDFDRSLIDIQNVSPTHAVVVGKQISYYVDVKSMKEVKTLIFTNRENSEVLKWHLKYIAFESQIKGDSERESMQVIGAYDEGPRIKGSIFLSQGSAFSPPGIVNKLDNLKDYKIALYSEKHKRFFFLRNVGHGQEIVADGYAIQTSGTKDDASFMALADEEKKMLICNRTSCELVVVDLEKDQVLHSINTDPIIETVLPIQSTPYAVVRTLGHGNPARYSMLRIYNYKEGRLIGGSVDVGKSAGSKLSHHCMASTPDGKTICVCNPMDNTVSILSIE